MSDKISNKDALMRAVGDLSEGILDPEMAETIAEGLISRGFVVDEDALREKHGISVQPAPIASNEESVHDLVVAQLFIGLPSGPMGGIPSSNYNSAHTLFKNLCSKAGKDPIEVIRARKRFGFEKYGTILQSSNGRDHLEDAIDEVADALVYLMCIRWQEEEAKK
ncbi:hypothetical protein TIN2_106 [Tsukamurella phage TIN2]|uniref:Uncharacterized protein n=1 Tax=Tsukamurella phage TIN2 TaxID=1636545 RepID=A0A0K0N5D1_9CAUD|nr:hypothetical protein AVT55_gp017 [Tsukamurella phage TIN2]AKJ71796.1 hypothetical protein TIN2_106 [Tsukamurella phage TIN2]